jgi:CxxC motif-containing protein (DUF1111 family)
VPAFRRGPIWLVPGIAAGLLVACAQLFTEAPAAGDVFDGPLDGLTPAELAAFVRGDGEFERRFAASTGLGPIFNNVSCASCHSGDGRGVLENALTRIGGVDDEFLELLGGPQIQTRAIPGAVPEQIPADVALSLRLPPPVFGVGLIEAIPDATLLALADPDDRDGDGISGRANLVRSAPFVPLHQPGSGERSVVGRFGRKAQTATLLEQVATAYIQDIGITSDFIPVEIRNASASVETESADRVADPELPASTVLAVVHYLRTLAPPEPAPDDDAIRAGRTLFTRIGCGGCHVPTLRTGSSAIAAIANRDVQLYSDLLLHDMGDGLADRRPDGDASGREWKTPPLWGLRLMRAFLDGRALLLHDGRASSVEEAILLHGGEARASRDAFAALNAAERSQLLRFVESR